MSRPKRKQGRPPEDVAWIVQNAPPPEEMNGEDFVLLNELASAVRKGLGRRVSRDAIGAIQRLMLGVPNQAHDDEPEPEPEPSPTEQWRACRRSIFASASLHPREKLLLLALGEYADHAGDTAGGHCYPTVKMLAAMTGRTTGNVRATLRRLESRGWLTRHAMIGFGGRRIQNLYQFHRPATEPAGEWVGPVTPFPRGRAVLVVSDSAAPSQAPEDLSSEVTGGPVIGSDRGDRGDLSSEVTGGPVIGSDRAISTLHKDHAGSCLPSKKTLEDSGLRPEGPQRKNIISGWPGSETSRERRA